MNNFFFWESPFNKFVLIKLAWRNNKIDQMYRKYLRQ